jgi:Predicted NTP pyrophosphohydrolase
MQVLNEKSAGAIIFRKKDSEIYYLLLHAKYKTDYWEFPKGLIEKNEDLESTVRREIFEECGLKDIKFINGFKESINYFYRRGDKLIMKEVIYFLVESLENNVRISSEHVGYEWVKYEEAIPRLKENLRKVLTKAKDFLVKQRSLIGN